MGWFDEQIKTRKTRDNDDFAEAMESIAAVIARRPQNGSASRRQQIKNAMDEILLYYHARPAELPDEVEELNDQLEFLCRPYGIMRRRVRLEKDWYKDAAGAMLGTKKDGATVALIPGKLGGYSFYEDSTGKRVRLNRKTAALLEEEAICFYKPFPLRRIGVPALMKYIVECVPPSSLALVLIMAAVTTLVGMLSPKITHLIFSEVVPSGNHRLLLAMAVFSVCVAVSSLLFDTVRSLINERINMQMSVSVQAATMARVFSLPPDFFRNFSAGELTTRIEYMGDLCSALFSSCLLAGLASVFSLAYLSQIFAYAPALAAPALCITAATLAFSVLHTVLRMKRDKRAMDLAGRKNGMTYALFTGIQKIRLAGAEKRAFSRWMRLYTQEVRNTYGLPLPELLGDVISTGISLAGAIVMYYYAVRSGISVADYCAFTAAYGVVSGAFASLVDTALEAAKIRPTLEIVEPILHAVPEISEEKKVVTRLSGGIELNNVSFRYSGSMPLVIDDLSLKIRPGQYVAIVGRTGCGKSTLLRLLLGFETPEKGAIYYDGRDLSALDLKSLRRKIGVVMQDGKLFQGDIFSNITVSAPWLTLDDAWEAAELAGIADDIRAMPMGMHTIISEGSGGISGGQRQRLMIARAIAPKPKILMFDEATSALDNITQKKVSRSLDRLKCTRIVIAHRLSTIRQCDRILVLEGGKIVEDGDYEGLLAKNGFFAELVARQRIET